MCKFHYPKIIVRALFLCIGIALLAFQYQKKDDWTPIAALSADNESFAMDVFDHLYIINGHRLERYILQDTAYSHQLSFSQMKNGSIASLDTSDPMRLLVFYADFGHLLWLDQDFTPIGSSVCLPELGLDAVCVCSSQQGGFWLFDRLDYKLKRINTQRKLAAQSIALDHLISQQPTYLVERNNYLYMLIPHQALFIFNAYGSIHKELYIKDITNIQVDEEAIYYLTAQSVYLKKLNLVSNSIDSLRLPTKDSIKDFHFHQKKLTAKHNNKIVHYQYKTSLPADKSTN